MYKKSSPEWIEHLDFEILDFLCICVSFIFVEYVRCGDLSLLIRRGEIQHVLIIFYATLISIFFMAPHTKIIQRGYLKELSTLIRQFLVIYVLWVISLYLQHQAAILPRLSYAISFALAVTLDFTLRVLRKNQIRKSLWKKDMHRRTLVISDSDKLLGTIEQLLTKKYTDMQICAICLPSDQTTVEFRQTLKSSSIFQEIKKRLPTVSQNAYDTVDFDIISGTENCMEYLRTHIIDEVVIDQYDNRGVDWEDFVFHLLEMGQVVHITIGHFVTKYPNLTIDHYGNRYMLTTTNNTVYRWQLSLKRMMDICGALVGLVLTGIISIFVIPAIKIADPGPVIFTQKRVGKNGRVFNFYKFRSMYVDAEERKAELMSKNEMNGLMFKIENDPRIIGAEKGPGKGIGNFIRRTSIDELPQFWNILKGDMSLVGTRPPTLEEYKQYETKHKIRLSMQPGLTGLWQVSGRSDITDFEEVVRLDTEYIENWNLGIDIKILFQTLLIVVNGRGSK